jgi:hypothetical protein
MGVCSCTVCERGHVFDLRSRAHLEGLSSLLLQTHRHRRRGERRPIAGRIRCRTRSRGRSVSEAHMRAAAYVVDDRYKARERLVCMPRCVLMLCKASTKHVKAAHQQRPSTRSVEVDLDSCQSCRAGGAYGLSAIPLVVWAIGEGIGLCMCSRGIFRRTWPSASTWACFGVCAMHSLCMQQLRREGDTHRRRPSAKSHELGGGLDAHQMITIASLRVSQMRREQAHPAPRQPRRDHVVGAVHPDSRQLLNSSVSKRYTSST